jgi:hypothetical protein
MSSKIMQLHHGVVVVAYSVIAIKVCQYRLRKYTNNIILMHALVNVSSCIAFLAASILAAKSDWLDRFLALPRQLNLQCDAEWIFRLFAGVGAPVDH